MQEPTHRMVFSAKYKQKIMLHVVCRTRNETFLLQVSCHFLLFSPWKLKAAQEPGNGPYSHPLLNWPSSPSMERDGGLQAEQATEKTKCNVTRQLQRLLLLASNLTRILTLKSGWSMYSPLSQQQSFHVSAFKVFSYSVPTCSSGRTSKTTTSSFYSEQKWIFDSCLISSSRIEDFQLSCLLLLLCSEILLIIAELLLFKP